MTAHTLQTMLDVCLTPEAWRQAPKIVETDFVKSKEKAISNYVVDLKRGLGCVPVNAHGCGQLIYKHDCRATGTLHKLIATAPSSRLYSPLEESKVPHTLPHLFLCA
jgi:hypothetical protein